MHLTHSTNTFSKNKIMLDNKLEEKLSGIRTPFYYYEMDVLGLTVDNIKREADRYGFKVHYALKSNANPKILRILSSSGFGADCVSGNEIEMATECGFSSEDIVFAGVGKTDEEIITGIDNDIFCFNVESAEEVSIINDLSRKKEYISRISLRINPNVEANTHKYITTGIEESKFGINMRDIEDVTSLLGKLDNIELLGLHFHIGSQIRQMDAFKRLCSRINEILGWFEAHNVPVRHINVGGGLGINYDDPEELPDFAEYFGIFNEHLERNDEQVIHFEPGRSVTGQSGSLITRVLYVKKGTQTDFAVVDAGMTDLIRPALYSAHHKIENISSVKKHGKYNVVGPICESSDSFGKYIDLPETHRGDLLAIRSAGAYGEVMASNYNLRKKAVSVFSDEI